MNNIIEKGGKRAQIGEIREFGGRSYIKTSDGWKFHGKGTGAKTKQHIENTKQHNAVSKDTSSSQNEQKPKSTPKWNLEGKSQKQLEDELKDLKYNDSKDNLTNTGKSKIKAIEDKLSQMSSNNTQSSKSDFTPYKSVGLAIDKSRVFQSSDNSLYEISRYLGTGGKWNYTIKKIDKDGNVISNFNTTSENKVLKQMNEQKWTLTDDLIEKELNNSLKRFNKTTDEDKKKWLQGVVKGTVIGYNNNQQQAAKIAQKMIDELDGVDSKSSNDSKDDEQQSQNEADSENSLKNYNPMNYDTNPHKIKVGDKVIGYRDNGLKTYGTVEQIPTQDSDEFVIQSNVTDGRNASYDKLDFTQLSPIIRIKEDEKPIGDRSHFRRGYDVGDTIINDNGQEFKIEKITNRGNVTLVSWSSSGKKSKLQTTVEELNKNIKFNKGLPLSEEGKKYAFDKLYHKQGLNKLSIDKQQSVIEDWLKNYDSDSNDGVMKQIKRVGKGQLLLKQQQLELEKKNISPLKKDDKIHFEKMGEFGGNNNEYKVQDVWYDDYNKQPTVTVSYEKGSLLRTLNLPLSKVTANNGQ